MAVAVSHHHQHPHLLASPAAAPPRRPRPRDVPVCTFWLQGRCARSPCKFAHTLPAVSSPPEVPATTQQQQQPRHRVWRRPTSPAAAAAAAAEEVAATAQQQPDPRIWRRPTPPPPAEEVAATAQQQQQQQYSETTQKQHRDFISTTKDAAFVAHLAGHPHCVTGVAFPHGSTKLFTAGQDAMVRAWDCTTGQCTEVLPVSGTVSCLFNSDSDPDWLFLGLPDEVRAWNLHTNSHQSLQATNGGQVLSITSCGDLLLAGLEKGAIFVWRFDPATASFLPATSLFGHTASVVALEPSSSISSKHFYSGSTDGTIRVWDLGTGQCLQVLQGHTRPVTKLLSSEEYLLSTSLDGRVKVWGLNTSSSTHTPVLQLQYTYPLEAAKEGCSSVLALCGVIDQDSKPILFCASSDSTVRILELPSFTERGVLFTPHPIQAMDTGSAGLLFLGGSDGGITVWRWQPAR